MILSDQAILAAIERGDVRIEPFDAGNLRQQMDPEQLNPASYDVTLGDEVAVYDAWVDSSTRVDGDGPVDGRRFYPRQFFPNHFRHLQVEVPRIDEKLSVSKFRIDPEVGWVVLPEIGYLMHTRERIYARNLVPIIDGKSSCGRLFLQVHSTAGFGEPGYDGQYTLEVTVKHPIRIFPGMRIGQVRFHRLEGEVLRGYAERGNYVGERAVGAVASRAWNQFKKKGGGK